MINKNYWLNFNFREDFPLDIDCPMCGQGKLQKAGDFTILETRNTVEINKQKNHAFEIEDLEEKFSGLLSCGYCDDVVALCGTSNPDHDFDEEDPSIEYAYYRRFNPEYFSPPLQIFKLKPEYPSKVKKILEASFSIFFMDNDSCGNKIRISIEALLDELGIDKKKPGTDKIYSLHQRILKYQTVDERNAELMISIKWIGNYGSHDESISRSDLLDAYQMINSILDNLYDNQEKLLQVLVKKINDNQKPASKIITIYNTNSNNQP